MRNRFRLATRSLLVVSAVSSLLVGGVQAANAQSWAVSTIQSNATGRCVDDSAQYGTRSLSCNGLSFQRWNRSAVIETPFRFEFQNAATGMCLDDSTQYGLRTWHCSVSHTNLHQMWLVISNQHGVYLKNQQTGRCLDDSSYGLRPFSCNGLVFQGFRFG